MSEYAEARLAMVNNQIRPSDVTDHALQDALTSVPREIFIPKSQMAKAHADIEVALGEGRYMLRPREFAKLVQAARIAPTDVVLDIGCGRGYSTAILARLCETVIAVENASIGQVDKTSERLASINADNAVVIEGTLEKGAPGQGPFDVIFVNGAVHNPVQAWLDQLAEGGRLAVFERDGRVGRATIYTKANGQIGERAVFDSVPPMLPGFEPEPNFVF
jgi:protein-L-isoaspartate(D-aspartate) O-methyltransferase